ncbi:MAG: hypothetical protein U9R47_11415 [Actinomycetota bacterium]|nr:hypothetical protein [Actinomycetota bacterium]
MTDELTVDEALAAIISLSTRIDEMESDDPKRVVLEHRRHELRADVQQAADVARSAVGLRNELGTLRRRLAQIDDRPIGRGWAEKARYRWVRWVNNPGAYSSRINEMLDTQDADEREVIVHRIKEIEAVLNPVEE